jgi:hypothetical protein
VFTILGAGVGISYLVWRQLETKMVTFEQTAQLAPNGEGEMCGHVNLHVDARTLGLWQFHVEQGRSLNGAMVVQGSEDADVGFRIRTPGNRLLLRDPERQHEQFFDLAAPVRGEYTFEIDNRHSTLTGKDVVVMLCVA